MYSNPYCRRRGFRRNSGFTLVEVIVAITIITVGVLSTVSVANVSSQASATNEQRVAALNLAREGIELVRNTRDSNWQAYAYALQQYKQSGTINTLAGIPGVSEKDSWACFSDNRDSAQGQPNQSCDANNSFIRPSGSPPLNLIANLPPTQNARPYFSIVSTGTTSTSNSKYRICAQPLAGDTNTPPPAVFQPAPAGTACSSKVYYRRVQISAGKDAGTFKVESHVNWDERIRKFQSAPDKGDIVVEEYLTDWRRFEDAGTPSPSPSPVVSPGPTATPAPPTPGPVKWSSLGIGKDLVSCQVTNDRYYCLTDPDGTTLYSLTSGRSGQPDPPPYNSKPDGSYPGNPPFAATYKTTGLAPGAAQLIITYKNENGALDASPRSTYHIIIKTNGVAQGNPIDLPIQLGGTQKRSVPINITVPTAPNPQITISWDNDIYMRTQYDNNFAIIKLEVKQ